MTVVYRKIMKILLVKRKRFYRKIKIKLKLIVTKIHTDKNVNFMYKLYAVFFLIFESCIITAPKILYIS